MTIDILGRAYLALVAVFVAAVFCYGAGAVIARFVFTLRHGRRG